MSPVVAAFADYVNCPQHRSIVLSYSVIVQVGFDVTSAFVSCENDVMT